MLEPGETPDGRPGVSVLFMTMSKDDLAKRLIERVGQTVLTCPTTACFDGLPDAPDRVGVGSSLRYFGDGFQSSKVLGGERFWRIPVMEGEFLVQEKFGMLKAVGGGNFLILARSAEAALAAVGSRGRGHGSAPGHHHAVPGRRGAERQQGGLPPLEDDDRLHQRRVLPHAPRGDADGAARRRELGARDRDQWRGRAGDLARDARRASTPHAARTWSRSAPATTAASSARTTSISGRS